MPSGQSIVDSLLERGWVLADSQQHPLGKLQGCKALNSQQAQLKIKAIAQELMAFLHRLPPVAGSELERAARNRALAILSTLGQ